MKPHSTQHPFTLGSFELEEIIPRLDNFETAVAIVDVNGKVVRANGLWTRRGGTGLCSEVGNDLIGACCRAAGKGCNAGFKLCEELRAVLEEQTESCDWLPATGERIRIARLVSGSGTYALVAFGERLAEAA
ncbi:MAG: hypothetical protein ACI8QC_001333 [Planctomycetota bacterium]|jgi:hypothetical protein